ncbi:MAG: hybrid sensor histidine kinase/response regulator [Candidatus Rokuibacteriota bacterium]|nr:MAG: hybrid sensor histidine kinase/response regulator [Candidatus Rokubacteria bacterium]
MADTARTPTRLTDVRVPRSAEERIVTVTVAPVAGAGQDVLVMIEDRDEISSLGAQLKIVMEQMHANAEEVEIATEELRATNESLRAANEDLHRQFLELEAAQQANENKDQFVAMLAHELRTPLAPVLSATEILRHRSGDRAAVEHSAEIIGRQMRHLARLVEDLLDIARMTRDKLVLKTAPIDIRAVIRRAAADARTLVEAKRQILDVSVPETPVTVAADDIRLEQILANLLSNAAKYTPAGGRIDVVARVEDAMAVVRVRDTGTGIPRGMLRQVFELFAQIPRDLARSEGGLGIGLALVKRLVELHGGTVTAASEGRGHGSEFVVRLPIVAASAQESLAFPAAVTAETPRSRRILVVEDNDDAREMLRESLTLEGHHVETAGDGRTALSVASAFHPDAALVDIGLPDMDGYEVALALRAKVPGISVIALSGYGQSEDRQRSHAAGCVAHLVKPVAIDDVQHALAALPAPGA